MKIEANDKTIQDIFAMGYFQIPRFQRPYSWGEDEVESFWNDVVNNEDGDYFIGSMVAYQIRRTYYGIVDGQQRLTTITVILAAIRNAFNSLKETDLAQGIHNYIERPNVDNKEEFIISAETSFPYLQDYIQRRDGGNVICKVGAEEQSLKSAFEFVTKRLTELMSPLDSNDSIRGGLFDDAKSDAIVRLKEIRDKVLALKLVFIQLDTEDDAYLIFETLNARGRDLTTLDLVKNLLLNKIKSHHVQYDAAKEIWKLMVRQFDDSGNSREMERFLYHYWLSKHEYTTDKLLFNKIKSYAKDRETAEKLLKDLQENAGYYVSILSPDNNKWSLQEQEVLRSLSALSSFKVKQPLPMVLALVRSYRRTEITLRQLKQSIEKIERFHYVFNAVTSQRSSGSISTNYSKYAIALSIAPNRDKRQLALKELANNLRDKTPSFEEFKASFDGITYTSQLTKNKHLIKYTLRKLMGTSHNGLAIDYDAMTIEHILPEASLRDEENLDLIIGSIGNLILVDSETNNEKLSDLPFDRKMATLKRKQYPLDSFLLEQTVWGKEQIELRTAKLIQSAYTQSIR